MTKLHTPTQGDLLQDMISEHVELASFNSHDSRTDNDSHAVHESSEALNQPISPEDYESTTQSPFHANETTINHSSTTQRKSAAQRLGRQTTIILVASLLLTLSVFAFLTFLWSAPHDHKLWRFIVVRGFAGATVTVSSLLLRTAVDLQAGAAVAMLAAILLENNFRLLVIDTAQVSKLRAGRAMPLDIVLPSIRTIQLEWRKGWSGFMRSVPTVSLVLPLVATTILLQLTSTILVSDLSLGTIPGKTLTEHPNIDLAYEWDGEVWLSPFRGRAVSTWLQNPPAFPTFAEFSENINIPEHVDDTGTLLRAFLPFQDAESRETISEYSGKAVVLDARVSCQRPLLQPLRFQLHQSSQDGMIGMGGGFGTTEAVTQLIGTVDQVPFNCSLGSPSGWNVLSICQPSGFWYGGGELISVLRDPKQWSTVAGHWSKDPDDFDFDYLANSAYLVFNTSWRHTSEGSNKTGTSVTLGHGAWTDVTYDYGDIPLNVDVSVSLCFPAAWIARLNVTLYSTKNRTEPVPLSSDKWFRTDPDVHVQMGESQHYHATPESRGTLALSPRSSWLPDPSDTVQYDLAEYKSGLMTYPFIFSSTKIDRTFLTMRDRDGRNGSLIWEYGPKSVLTYEGAPDFTIASIFTTSLEITNGSAATALSTILTIMSSMTYYDQFPNFAETAHNATTVYFETFLFPQSFRGFTAVLVITIVHCLLVLLIAATFITSTLLTLLGEHWQSVSQIVSPATESFLSKSSCATDKEVRALLKAGHRERETAMVQPLGDEMDRAGLVARRIHPSSSHGRSHELDELGGSSWVAA